MRYLPRTSRNTSGRSLLRTGESMPGLRLRRGMLGQVGCGATLVRLRPGTGVAAGSGRRDRGSGLRACHEVVCREGTVTLDSGLCG